MTPHSGQRFLGRPARPKRQRTRFPTPGLSRAGMRAKGGKYIGWIDYDNQRGERVQSTYTDLKDLPASVRVSTAGSGGSNAYYYVEAPHDQGDPNRNIQLARTATAMTVFLAADEVSVLLNANGHSAFRVPASMAQAGDIWGVNAPFGLMSMYSTPSSVTIFSGDIDSNIVARTAVGLNVRGFEIRFTVDVGAAVTEFSGNWVAVP